MLHVILPLVEFTGCYLCISKFKHLAKLCLIQCCLVQSICIFQLNGPVIGTIWHGKDLFADGCPKYTYFYQKRVARYNC
jgi:hypothetical protein